MKHEIKNSIVSLRLSDEEYNKLVELSDKYSVSVSEATRLALRIFYSNNNNNISNDNLTDKLLKHLTTQEKKLILLEGILYNHYVNTKNILKEYNEKFKD